MVFITMGTGFGAGLILDGRLYRGTNDMAGEIGHVRIADDGPVGYGKAGSAEGFCAGAGIAKRLRKAVAEALARGERTMLAGMVEDLDQLSAYHMGVAAKRGDKIALEVLHETARYLGRALAVIVDLLNPERIVIGSIAYRLGDLLLDPARRAMEGEALGISASVCVVVPSALGEQIGDYGAICAAIARDFDRLHT